MACNCDATGTMQLERQGASVYPRPCIRHEHSVGWMYRYTRKHYTGGQYVSVPLSLEHIPVFERE